MSRSTTLPLTCRPLTVEVPYFVPVIVVGADPSEWFDTEGNHPEVMAPAPQPRGAATPSTVVEQMPAVCRNGHRLQHPNVLVEWLPCTCAQPATGHRVIACRTCRAEWFRPQHVDPSQTADRWAAGRP